MPIFHSFFIDNNEVLIRLMNGLLYHFYSQQTQKMTDQAFPILVGKVLSRIFGGFLFS